MEKVSKKAKRWAAQKRKRAAKAIRQVAVTGFGHRSVGPKKGTGTFYGA